MSSRGVCLTVASVIAALNRFSSLLFLCFSLFYWVWQFRTTLNSFGSWCGWTHTHHNVLSVPPLLLLFGYIYITFHSFSFFVSDISACVTIQQRVIEFHFWGLTVLKNLIQICKNEGLQSEVYDSCSHKEKFITEFHLTAPTTSFLRTSPGLQVLCGGTFCWTHRSVTAVLWTSILKCWVWNYNCCHPGSLEPGTTLFWWNGGAWEYFLIGSDGEPKQLATP